MNSIGMLLRGKTASAREVSIGEEEEEEEEEEEIIRRRGGGEEIRK